jgi:acyl-CoA synthetase (AMP-forming)/AMP-acid ligase II
LGFFFFFFRSPPRARNYKQHSREKKNLKNKKIQSTSASGDIFIGVLPIFHVFGFSIYACITPLVPVRTVNLPRFDFGVFLTTISKEKATYLHVAPPIALALAKHPVVDKFDLSSVRTVFSGAAPLGAETEIAVAKRMSKSGVQCEMRQAYGMTELSPASHINPPGHGVPGTVGPLIPNCTAVVECLDTGKRLAPGLVLFFGGGVSFWLILVLGLFWPYFVI